MNQQIIFSFTVGQLESYDIFSSLFLCISWVLLFSMDLLLVVKEALWARREGRFGEQLLFAFFGQFGRNETGEPLKGSNTLSNLLRTPSLIVCICGLEAMFQLTVRQVKKFCQILQNGCAPSLKVGYIYCSCFILFLTCILLIYYLRHFSLTLAIFSN